MENKDSNVSDVQENQSNESTQETKEQFVKRQAYEEVSKDMHKFKSKLKEAEATANEYASKLKAIEESKLKEQERWQELYENERADKEKLNAERERERQLYLRSVKLSALKQELGNVKDIYLNHANLDGVEIREDGTLSSDSVLSVANQFRNDYPEVIPGDSNTNITAGAASNPPVQSDKLDLSKMSTQEKIDFYTKLKKNRS